ncbi:undecaprenyl-phosphate glucose phosphotransferase [Accumulibacter sp.]|uniref:undecaprenyl-phosphate glucose phosphotransferase n=1 Tax=Accumulibacter sp. TaxID=2053492 RepID=UPI002603BC0F|nr:undecaprenyl-phosphate glucose phosphotransferase [Accumulibacter sp.]
MPESSSALSASAVPRRRPPVPLGKDNLLSVIEALLDPAVAALSLWLLSFYFEGELQAPYLILSVLVFATIFPGSSRLQSSVWRLITDVCFSWAWMAFLLLVLGFTTRYVREFSSQALTIWLWTVPLLQIAAHLLLRAAAPYVLLLQGPPQRAVIVGMNEPGVALANRIRQTPYSRIELAGFFDGREVGRLDGQQSFPLLGTISDLPAFVKQSRIQLIFLSLPMASQPRIVHILDELKDTTASIYFVPDMFVTDLIQGRSHAVCGMPVISVCETPFTGANAAVKRCSDIVLSLLILILMSPLMLIIAAAVKFSSPGPIIFKQRRYGLAGEEILVYKFRSMTVCEDGGKIRQAQRNDSRVTRLGAFLRKTSLDELPQFVNVLQGRMSIVGPRPHAVAHNELYRNLIKGYMIRHKVKPGVTGWAQVNGYRGETDSLDKMQSRVNYDLDYLRNWTLRLDLHIILKTVLVVLRDQAAY